jgi:hypothetical protein
MLILLADIKMKIKILIVCGFVILTESACQKHSMDVDSPENVRKVQYQLYTEKDFGADTSIITFTAIIRTTDNLILWDSLLAPMKLMDIPGPADKIVFEKIVPYYSSPLKVGFEYSIKCVGHSHFIDSLGVNEKYRVVNFDFK